MAQGIDTGIKSLILTNSVKTVIINQLIAHTTLTKATILLIIMFI
jgi:hypothetical protein